MSTTTEPLTTEQLITRRARTLLTQAGLPEADVTRVLDLLPPRGQYEITQTLLEDLTATGWMSALWSETFQTRFRTYTVADAAEIQRILAQAVIR